MSKIIINNHVSNSYRPRDEPRRPNYYYYYDVNGKRVYSDRRGDYYYYDINGDRVYTDRHGDYYYYDINGDRVYSDRRGEVKALPMGPPPRMREAIRDAYYYDYYVVEPPKLMIKSSRR